MSEKDAIYLDANAGAPLRPEVVEALELLLRKERGGSLIPNPSSIHSYGRQAKRWVAEARERISLSLGASIDPEQLVVTSSGTESNQLAIRSCLEERLRRGERVHWITSAVEHDSTIQMIQWVKDRGGDVSLLPLDENGAPEAGVALGDLFRPETALVSVVWVNNETGVISDLAPIIAEAKARGVKVHVDAAQAWGKMPLDLNGLGADLVAFSAHKIGALSGSGLLWVARGMTIQGTVLGKQEKGRRGGSENVLGLVAMGAAASALNPSAWIKRVEPLRDRLQTVLLERIPGTVVNGGGARRVANTLNLSFAGVEGDSLVMALDLAGYSVSSGSACASGVLAPSHVLMAMGRTKPQAMAALRISLADELLWEQLEGFVDALEAVVSRVRARASQQMEESRGYAPASVL